MALTSASSFAAFTALNPASLPSQSISSSAGIAAFIANGLDVATSSSLPSLSSTIVSSNTPVSTRNDSSIANITASANKSSSSTSSLLTTSLGTTSGNVSWPTTWYLDVTGSPSSCYSALWEWYFSSSAAAVQSGFTTVQTLNLTYVFPQPYVPTTVYNATPLTALCDGHPRYATTAMSNISTLYEESTTTTILTIPDYPTTPCAIPSTDCVSLWHSYSSLVAAQTSLTEPSPLPPPCPTSSSSAVNFSDAICRNGINFIYADSAQLIYWPIRYANDSISATNVLGFCENGIVTDIISYSTPSTASGAQTASGPNTFVTGDMTITSPDVAILFSKVLVEPDCGTTTDIIVTLPASSLQSARGVRALAQPYHFDLNDLNWICEDAARSNGSWTTQDAEGPGCYQNVPALAYFSQRDKYDWWTMALGESSSQAVKYPILQDYRPQVDLYGQNYGFEMLQSVFGGYPAWGIVGVWDPPMAVTAASNLLAPTVNNADTTTAKGDPVATTPVPQQVPAPAVPTTTNAVLSSIGDLASIHALAGAQASTAFEETHAGAVKSIINSDTMPGDAGQGMTTDRLSVHDPADAIPGQTAALNSDILVVVGTGDTAHRITLPPTQEHGSNKADAVTHVLDVDGSSITVVASASNVLVNNVALKHGEVTSIGGQQYSVVDPGLKDDSALATTVKAGGALLTISPLSPSVVAVNDQVLTQNAAARTLAGGQQVSLGLDGIVIGTGTSATTLTVADRPAVYSVYSISSDVQAINGQTLTLGGLAKTLPDSEVASLGSSGVVVGTGKLASTLPMLYGKSVLIVTSTTSAFDASVHGGDLADGQTAAMSLAGTSLTIDGKAVSVASSDSDMGSTGRDLPSTAQSQPSSSIAARLSASAIDSGASQLKNVQLHHVVGGVVMLGAVFLGK